jgi:hypothetical protein
MIIILLAKEVWLLLLLSGRTISFKCLVLGKVVIDEGNLNLGT